MSDLSYLYFIILDSHFRSAHFRSFLCHLSYHQVSVKVILFTGFVVIYARRYIVCRTRRDLRTTQHEKSDQRRWLSTSITIHNTSCEFLELDQVPDCEPEVLFLIYQRLC